MCAGNDGSLDLGFGFDYVTRVCIAVKNYVSRDPDGMMKIGEGQTKSHLALIYNFIHRCLELNRNGIDDADGIAIVNIIVAMFENMHGKLDNDLPQLLTFLLDELNHKHTLSYPSKPYELVLLQAISMSFTYNSRLVFQWLSSKTEMLQVVFSSWFAFIPYFKEAHELRRCIFGLCAIMKTPPD